MPERSFQIEQAFSLFKQPDLATACQLEDINRKASIRDYAPSVPENAVALGDAGHFGKGHSFATYYDVINRRYVMPSRTYPMSDLVALFAFGMLMGKVTSDEVNPSPAVWDHTFTYKNPSSDADGLNCISTSFIEKLGGEGQYLYSGVVLNQVTVNGSREDHVTLQWDGAARKKATNVTSLPALSQLSYMKMLRCAFVFGASSASPEVVVSNQVLSFDLSLTQTPEWKWMPGTSEADSALASLVLVGQQGVSGSLSVFLDADHVALFENNTECMLRITCNGAIITGEYRRSVTIEIPHFNISAISHSQDGSTMALQLSFTNDSVLKVEGDDYVSVTVRTSLDDTELLVSST